MMDDEEPSISSLEQRGLDRILALSDGVFAFAITLLVLGLTLPTLQEGGYGQWRLNSMLLHSLAADTTAFYSYAISFAVIAIWWVAHHRLFRHIKKYDGALMWRNLLFLLFITIIPFLTQLMNQFGNIGVAVIIYDASQLMGGLALAAVWTHASKNHLLVSKSLTESEIKNIQSRNNVPLIVFMIALLLAAFFSYSYQYLGIAPGFANFALFGIAPMMRSIARKSNSKDEP